MASRPLPAGIHLEELVGDRQADDAGTSLLVPPTDDGSQDLDMLVPPEVGDAVDSPVEPSPSPSPSPSRKVAAIVGAWEGIGLPLLLSILTRGGPEEISTRLEAMAGLVGAVTRVGSQLADVAGSLPNGGDDWARWKSSVLAAELVAATFLETGDIPAEGAADELGRHLAGALKACESTQVQPEPWPAQVRAGRALVPVVVAINRYAFGRTPQALLSEVAGRLRRMADDAAAKIGILGEPTVLATFLTVLGQFYSLAHHGETDRLLSLPQSERDAIAARAPSGMVDMAAVWEEVERSFELLVEVVSHVRLPPESNIGGASWG